ncbi:MAG: hypothetical protein IH944_07900 [Armatimonadetes bacterium]|nr:hypothetical protein [Armatimonadota bacterium]
MKAVFNDPLHLQGLKVNSIDVPTRASSPFDFEIEELGLGTTRHENPRIREYARVIELNVFVDDLPERPVFKLKMRVLLVKPSKLRKLSLGVLVAGRWDETGVIDRSRRGSGPLVICEVVPYSLWR